MAIEIRMPAFAPSMTEGKLSRWVKKEGEAVKAGELLAEIETDKATLELEAAEEGVLGRIFVADGTAGVQVDSVLGLLVKAGERIPAGANGAIHGNGAPAKPVRATGAIPQPPPEAAANAPERTRLFASPVARRLAREHGLDLSAIRGSGPHGRIVKLDVEATVRSGLAAPSPAIPPAPLPSSVAPQQGGAAFDEIQHSPMRQVIARRLTEAKQQVPHFYLTVDCELDALLSLRREVNEALPDSKISVNDFVIKAVAVALRKVPAANASWTDVAVRRYRGVDISVAVAAPNGLITPVIRNADSKSLAAVSAEMKALAERARRGKLLPHEYQGGGFTISNLGMYGVREFAAVINPPQACILAVGAGEPRPVVKAGAVVPARVMTCTLSVDHRAVDGAVGAEFLSAFKAVVERPLGMLV